MADILAVFCHNGSENRSKSAKNGGGIPFDWIVCNQKQSLTNKKYKGYDSGKTQLQES